MIDVVVKIIAIYDTIRDKHKAHGLYNNMCMFFVSNVLCNKLYLFTK